MPGTVELRDPVRNIDVEFLQQLELLDNNIYPLPGGVGQRPGAVDSRLSHLKLQAGPAGVLKPRHGDQVVFYEHLATVRHRPTQTFFVAFRETMDALLARQQDRIRYPEWLMKSPVKKTELRIFLYRVTANPKLLPNLQSFEEWLAPIDDMKVHDALAYFLLQKKILTPAMFEKV